MNILTNKLNKKKKKDSFNKLYLNIVDVYQRLNCYRETGFARIR